MPYADPEAKKTYSRAYREKNKGALSEYDREYYKRNKAKRKKQKTEWYRANREAMLVKMRDSTPRYRAAGYGLTLEELQAMYVAQDYKCAICQRHEDTFCRSLAIDHCHSTGLVRGLLCGSCNTAIGRLGDNVEGLKRATAYLEKFEETTDACE